MKIKNKEKKKKLKNLKKIQKLQKITNIRKQKINTVNIQENKCFYGYTNCYYLFPYNNL